MIHAGESGSQWGVTNEEFMERMAESTQATVPYRGDVLPTYQLSEIHGQALRGDCKAHGVFASHGTGAQSKITRPGNRPFFMGESCLLGAEVIKYRQETGGLTMAVFHINRTNDAVFKAIFAKYSKITLAPYQCFP